MHKCLITLMTKRFETLAEERLQLADTISRLEQAGFTVDICWVDKENEAHFIEQLQGAETVFCCGNPPLNRHVLENCPDLRLIQRDGIGVDSIDAAAATDCGILVCNVVGYCIEELAVNALAMALANLRNTACYDRRMRRGEWPKGAERAPRRLSTLTFGLFGFGGSGAALAKMVRNGFGCRVLAYDPYPNRKQAEELGVELVSFDEMLAGSDIVSIHAPLLKSTYHAFDRAAFSKMRPNAILINISRGGIIDEDALAEALETGKIDSAGLDVFEHEPLPASSRLLQLEQTILSPHSSFQGVEARQKQIELSTLLPSRIIFSKEVYTKYLINKDVLDRLTGYRVLCDLEA